MSILDTGSEADPALEFEAHSILEQTFVNSLRSSLNAV